MLLPGDELELFLFFSGAWEGQMGMRSTMGAHLDVARLGARLDGGGRGVEMDERALEAVWNTGRVRAVLERLSRRHQLVLGQYYRPLTPGESAHLERLRGYVRIVLDLVNGDRAKLVKLCDRAGGAANKHEVVEARARVAALIGAAQAELREAQGAYADGVVARQQTRIDRRPWYTSRGEHA